jgi:hypothetical protein
VRITSRSVKGTSIEVYLPRADSRVSSDGKAASPSIVSDHVVFVAHGNGVPVVTRMRRNHIVELGRLPPMLLRARHRMRVAELAGCCRNSLTFVRVTLVISL